MVTSAKLGVQASVDTIARRQGDARGEALPVAILFSGVLLTILIGVHVIVAAMARTAVQSAADAAVSAAQVAGEGERQAAGEQAALLAMAAAQNSVGVTRAPRVIVEPERGSVTVVVFGSAPTPVLGRINFVARACGPLDDVRAAQLTASEPWEC